MVTIPFTYVGSLSQISPLFKTRYPNTRSIGFKLGPSFFVRLPCHLLGSSFNHLSYGSVLLKEEKLLRDSFVRSVPRAVTGFPLLTEPANFPSFIISVKLAHLLFFSPPGLNSLVQKSFRCVYLSFTPPPLSPLLLTVSPCLPPSYDSSSSFQNPFPFTTSIPKPIRVPFSEILSLCRLSPRFVSSNEMSFVDFLFLRSLISCLAAFPP